MVLTRWIEKRLSRHKVFRYWEENKRIDVWLLILATIFGPTLIVPFLLGFSRPNRWRMWGYGVAILFGLVFILCCVLELTEALTNYESWHVQASVTPAVPFFGAIWTFCCLVLSYLGAAIRDIFFRIKDV